MSLSFENFVLSEASESKKAELERWLETDPRAVKLFEKFSKLSVEARSELNVTAIEQNELIQMVGISHNGTVIGVAGSVVGGALQILNPSLSEVEVFIRDDELQEKINALSEQCKNLTADNRKDLAKINENIQKLSDKQGPGWKDVLLGVAIGLFLEEPYPQLRALILELDDASHESNAEQIDEFSEGENVEVPTPNPYELYKSPKPQDFAQRYIVQNNGINMRLGPSVNTVSRGHLNAGDEIVVVEEAKEWLRVIAIRTGEIPIVCWVHRDALIEPYDASSLLGFETFGNAKRGISRIPTARP